MLTGGLLRQVRPGEVPPNPRFSNPPFTPLQLTSFPYVINNIYHATTWTRKALMLGFGQE